MTENNVRTEKDIGIMYNLSLLRDTTFLIAFISVLGYFTAFNYQKGFKSFYGIDEIFLSDITITQILISIASIIGVFIFFYPFYPIIQSVFILDKTKERWILSRYIVKYWIASPLLIAIFLKFYFNINLNTVLYVLIVYYFFSVPQLLIPSIFTEGKNYIQKLRRNILEDVEPPFMEKLKFKLQSVRNVIILGLLFIMLIGSFAHLLGYANALKKDTYYIFEHQNQTYLIISNYNESVIIAPFDKDKNTMYSSYIIIELVSSFDDPIMFEKYKLRDNLKIK